MKTRLPLTVMLCVLPVFTGSHAAPATNVSSMGLPVEVSLVAIPEPYAVVELARANGQSVEQLLRERFPAGPLAVVVARRGDAYFAEATSVQERRQIIVEVASIINQFAASSTFVDICAVLTQKKVELLREHEADVIITEIFLGRTSAQTCSGAAAQPVEEAEVEPIAQDEEAPVEMQSEPEPVPDPVETFHFPWKTLGWVLVLLGTVAALVFFLVRARHRADRAALQRALPAGDVDALSAKAGIYAKDAESISDLVARLMLNSVVLCCLSAAPVFAQVDALIDVTHTAHQAESIRWSKAALAPLLLDGLEIDLYAVGDSTRLLTQGITTLAHLEAALDSLPRTDQHTRLSEAFLQAARRALERQRQGKPRRTTVLITDFFNDDAENAALAFYPHLAATGADTTTVDRADASGGGRDPSDPGLRAYVQAHLVELLVGSAAFVAVLGLAIWLIVRRVRRVGLRAGKVTALRVQYADRRETLSLTDLQFSPFPLEIRSFQPAYLHVVKQDGHGPRIVISSNGSEGDTPKDTPLPDRQVLSIELMDRRTQQKPS